MIVIKARLTESISSLASEKLNLGKIKLDKKELSALSSWIPQATDLEELKQLSKYINLFFKSEKHVHLVARISSDEKARNDENRAHSVLTDWLKRKVKVAMDTPVMGRNEISDIRISRLVGTFRASLSSFIN